MRPYVAELSKICDTYVCVYPNAGLPNPMAETGFDETPSDTSGLLEEFARAGLVNVVGGCCGTTPEHIRAIAEKVRTLPHRQPPVIPVKTRLSGLEPLNFDRDTLFINVGERTNVTGSKMFLRLIREEKFDEALSVASRWRTAPRSSTSTWTRACSTPWPSCRASSTCWRPSRTSRACR
jgi:5-methyltetrahydrofolate--homocysteine methyltransferase